MTPSAFLLSYTQSSSYSKIYRWILSSKREAQLNAKQIILARILLESNIVQDGPTHTPGIEGLEISIREEELLTEPVKVIFWPIFDQSEGSMEP